MQHLVHKASLHFEEEYLRPLTPEFYFQNTFSVHFQKETPYSLYVLLFFFYMATQHILFEAFLQLHNSLFLS